MKFHKIESLRQTRNAILNEAVFPDLYKEL